MPFDALGDPYFDPYSKSEMLLVSAPGRSCLYLVLNWYALLNYFF